MKTSIIIILSIIILGFLFRMTYEMGRQEGYEWGKFRALYDSIKESEEK